MPRYILEGRDLESRETPKDQDYPSAPCIFCGREIKHFNDDGSGWILGAMVDGKPKSFLYCDQPPCEESLAAYPDPNDPTSDVWRCGEGSAFVENVGDICHDCERPRAEHKPWEG